MLLFLQDEKWSQLNTQEKLDVMQSVANIESHYLGLPNELNVSVVNLENGTLGSYVDGIHTIYISLPLVMTRMFFKSDKYSAIKNAEVVPSKKTKSPFLISLMAARAIFFFSKLF